MEQFATSPLLIAIALGPLHLAGKSAVNDVDSIGSSPFRGDYRIVDDDGILTTAAPVEDAFVRDGTFAASNFSNLTDLKVLAAAHLDQPAPGRPARSRFVGGPKV